MKRFLFVAAVAAMTVPTLTAEGLAPMMKRAPLERTGRSDLYVRGNT